MKLYDFSTVTNEDGTQIVRVAGRIADHPDPAEQKESLSFQFSFDAPTVRNGAILRQEALEKARDILQELSAGFGRIGRRT